MVTIPRPRPGTVAAQIPVPSAVEEAVRLIEEGVDIPDAVDRVAQGKSAEELRAAQIWWVRRMPKHTWKDTEASDVLRVLERALANRDGLVTERTTSKRRR